MSRLLRLLVASAALALILPVVSHAQDEIESQDGETSSGNPYYGYVGTGVVGAMILFAVCKSARR